MMKTIGQILLWAGFLSGALATVFHAPSAGVKFLQEEVTPEMAKESRFQWSDLSDVDIPVEGWDLIPWTWYLVSVGVCVAGIVMIWANRKSEGQKSEQTESSLAEIKKALDRLIDNIVQLASEMDELPPSHVAERIDNVLAEDLGIFADGRNSITAEFGLDRFADVMTQFAAGERSINRAWSASADGYVDEAESCVDRGLEMFQEAKRILNEPANEK